MNARTGEARAATWGPRVARWLWVAFLALLVLGLWMQELNGVGGPAQWPLALAFSAFPTLGMIVVSRQPDNRIGWALGLVGVVVLSLVAEQYARYALLTEPGSLPLGPVALWFAHWLWIVALGAVATFVLLLFPTGRLPSPRWRWAAWASAVALAVSVVSSALQPAFEGPPRLDNPFGAPHALGPLVTAVQSGGLLAVTVLAVVSASSLLFRFRRAQGPERQQLKWLAWAMVPFVVATSGANALPGAWSNVAVAVGVGAVAAAMGVAIFRYRLYDIDVIINRTLVYGGLSAVLALAYAGCVVVVGTLVNALTTAGQSHPVVVAGSTLMVAALFRPARRGIQGFIDRRFYRRRYDAIKTVEGFSRRLRDEVDIGSITGELLAAARATMQPTHASLWLRR